MFKVNEKHLKFLEKKLARQWLIGSSTLLGRVTSGISRYTQNRKVSNSNPTDAFSQALGYNLIRRYEAPGDLWVVLEILL